MDKELKLTPEEIRDIAAKAYADPVFFMKFFLPHKFPKNVPWVHRGILAILTRKTEFLMKYGELEKIASNFLYRKDPSDDQSELLPIFIICPETKEIKLIATKFNNIMLPRGYSKTTLVGQGVILYWIEYQEYKFPVYISETQTHAETQVNNVAKELEVNTRLKAVFGDIVPERQSRLKWTQEIIQTTTGVTVVARGRGTQIRGLNVDGQRPDVLVLDDVEDRDSVKVPEQRKKDSDWFYGDVLPALPEMNPNATIMALGTLLHSEALLNTLRKDPDWTSIVFGVWDLQGLPLWADNMSADKIKKKKAMYTRNGKLGTYYLEYENTVRNEDSQKFKQSYIMYSPAAREELVGVAIALDPAISQKASACDSAIAVVGMTDKGLITVLETWNQLGATPNEQLEEYFRLAFKWDVTLYGIESIAFQAALIHITKEWMFRKRRYFEVVPITHSKKKEERIEGVLQPRYASGYMRHARRFPELEEQMLDWPNGKKDVIDVVAMAVALLDPHAASAANDNGKDLGEDEMPPLDEVFNGDWRSY